jgi:hypothetical protein
MTMKIFSPIFLLISFTGLVAGQNPPIGIIDFYGLRTVSEGQARLALQIKEGDSIPEPRTDAERRLETLPNVQRALLTGVCCEEGKAILYVGIEEKGAPSLKFRPAPKGRIRLPEIIVRAGDTLADALAKGILAGDNGEDDSQGHAFSTYPAARAIQERFVTFASQELGLLRTVLHESADPQHRALAAEVIAYTPNKRDVVTDLIYGMGDPNSDVRNSSMRALAVIAGFNRRFPKQHIRVPVTPFVKMLDSLVWTDRNKSVFALYQLTETRDRLVLSLIRREALQSLIEMARCKSSSHAHQPFVLLGRVGGISEEEIQKDWDSGNREGLIKKVLIRLK